MKEPAERIKEDIIDNIRGDITMEKILNSEIPRIRQFDVSSGYFDVEGWGLLRESLETAIRDGRFSMRLLLGTETTLSNNETFEKYAHMYEQHRYIHMVDQELNEAPLDLDIRSNSISLMNFLRNDRVEVRLSTNRFNHSKCYIMGNDSVFIGSSNFTKGGLTRNNELNAGLYQPGVAKLTREWFERMWKDSVDTKQKLINILKQSKFGVPADPFEIYMKILFERYFPQISEMKNDENVETGDLAQFQKEAVKIGLTIISEYNGVMISDSTGLGKTNMGIAILRHKISHERKRAIIIAPAQVKDSVWEEKLREADVSVRRILTHSELAGYKYEDFVKFRNIDFVLVDESQGFRAQHAKRRENLMTLLDTGKKKQIVLLSATPINNSLMDLYYQLLLITGEESNYFANSIGISNLYKHMRDAANTNKKIGLEKVQQLLDAVMIRRTRSYIRDVYPDDKIGGEKIKFPNHSYSPIRYNLSKMYPNLFQNMAIGSTKLTMAPYGIEYYNKTLTKKEQEKARVTAHLQKIMLLKRFESSVEAGKISLDNKIRMYSYVLEILKQNQKKILRVADFNKVMKKWNIIDDGENLDNKREADELEVELIEKIEKIELVDGKNYKLDALEKDIKADLNVLKDMRRMVDEVSIDTKLNAVFETIMIDGALKKEKGKSGKILIFTEYAATARYILQKLGGKTSSKKQFRNNKNGSMKNDRGLLPIETKIDMISGSTSLKDRRRIIRAFAPNANATEDEPFVGEEIDVLISTEILAEGQNLQDCNYVISYDLPWNPMRIVQRTGRIDRLTSKFDTVYSRACYPDKELDELLKLMGKLTDKIHTVDDTIGDEGSILGVPMTPRMSNESAAEIISKLSKTEDHAKIIEEMQREMDMMPATSLMNLISGHVKKIGIEEMKVVPMGRRSGKKGEGQKVVLAYLQKEPHRYVHFVVYDYKRGMAEILDEPNAMKLIECTKEYSVHMPMDQGDNSQKSFEELIRIDHLARQAIRDKKRHDLEAKLRGDDKVGKKRRKVSNDLEKTLTKAFTSGQITEDDANRILDLIKKPRLTRRYKELDRILLEYENIQNGEFLIREITNIADSLFFSDRDKEQDEHQIYDKPEHLVLVGAMFTTGDKFIDELDKGGLRKTMTEQ